MKQGRGPGEAESLRPECTWELRRTVRRQGCWCSVNERKSDRSTVGEAAGDPFV